MELPTIVAVGALVLSGLGFYRSYIYEKQALDITVTEVSYVTNQGELYMTVAFANGGTGTPRCCASSRHSGDTATTKPPSGFR